MGLFYQTSELVIQPFWKVIFYKLKEKINLKKSFKKSVEIFMKETEVNTVIFQKIFLSLYLIKYCSMQFFSSVKIQNLGYPLPISSSKQNFNYNEKNKTKDKVFFCVFFSLLFFFHMVGSTITNFPLHLHQHSLFSLVMWASLCGIRSFLIVVLI